MRFGGIRLLLLCSQLSTIASAGSCLDEIQKDCMFARVGSLAGQTDKSSCLKCAEQHKTDLEKVCSATQQVEQFCESAKPVLGGYPLAKLFNLLPTDAANLSLFCAVENQNSYVKRSDPSLSGEVKLCVSSELPKTSISVGLRVRCCGTLFPQAHRYGRLGQL